MTYSMKINKKPVSVSVPDVEEVTLSGDQLQQLIQKWHRNTAMYLARLQLLKEDSVIEANKEKLNFAVQYGMSLGISETQARTAAEQMLKAQDPNFRTEPTSELIFTAEDMIRTLKISEDEDSE